MAPAVFDVGEPTAVSETGIVALVAQALRLGTVGSLNFDPFRHAEHHIGVVPGGSKPYLVALDEGEHFLVGDSVLRTDNCKLFPVFHNPSDKFAEEREGGISDDEIHIAEQFLDFTATEIAVTFHLGSHDVGFFDLAVAVRIAFEDILHALGALVVAGALSFEDGLKLVYARAMAMQKACEQTPSTMAAIVGLADDKIEAICAEVSQTNPIVVPANYNCPGQLVISGTVEAINAACDKLKEAGAKRALPLKVGGAFHSPLMQPAKDELQAAIEATEFATPKCAVYQNVDGKPHTDPAEIKQNLIAQLTSSVRWTSCVENMIADGADDFTECGPGKALQGMIGRINKNVAVCGIA